MTRSTAFAVGVCCALGVTLVAQGQPAAPSSTDLVELDVVVVDNQRHPVRGLRLSDFQIKEDGQAVDIKTFATVTALGSTQPDDARSVVLLLDDSGIPMAGTSPMQAIARAMLSGVGQGDEVAVVRLNVPSDEAFGDLDSALIRIDGYRGGRVPFSYRDTAATTLKVVASLSRQLASIEHRRKAIICIGVPAACDMLEPPPRAFSVLWEPWVKAITAAAQANVSIYAVDPTGLSQGRRMSGEGLVEMTGGESFANSNDFQQAAGIIWDEASHYYLLGYWPAGKKRDLHSIDVKVLRKGVQVHARRRRGD